MGLTHLRRDRLTLAALACVIAIAVVAIAAPLVVDVFGVGGPNARNPGSVSVLGLPSGPSGAHPLGVDDLGRDVLARIVYGARSALEVGLLGSLIASVLGAVVGFAAVLVPRRLRVVVAAGLDALLAIPAVLLGVGIGLACGTAGCAGGLVTPGRATVIFAVAVAGLGVVARVVMRHASSERRRVVLARLAVTALRLVPMAILLEVALGFLGVGVGRSTADWGQMIASAGHDVRSGNSDWWAFVFPGVALTATVLSFGLLARGVARAVADAPRSAPADPQEPIPATA